MKITISPIGNGIIIGSTTVQSKGIGILINGIPSKGLTAGGGIGMIAGGMYPTGQYFKARFGRKSPGFSIGGKPLGIGKVPTIFNFLQNSFQ
jgi:hypothetical protein